MNSDKKQAAYRQGVVVLVILAILTGVEYAIAVTLHEDAIVLLFVISILKAAPILYFFMHIASLWSEEEGH